MGKKHQDCARVTLSSPSFYAGAGDANFPLTVTPPSGTCRWSASSPVPWVSFPAQTFPTTGTKTITVRVQANVSGAFRTTAILIGKVWVEVKQEAVAPAPTPVPEPVPTPTPIPDPVPDPVPSPAPPPVTGAVADILVGGTALIE